MFYVKENKQKVALLWDIVLAGLIIFPVIIVQGFVCSNIPEVAKNRTTNKFIQFSHIPRDGSDANIMNNSMENRLIDESHQTPTSNPRHKIISNPGDSVTAVRGAHKKKANVKKVSRSSLMNKLTHLAVSNDYKKDWKAQASEAVLSQNAGKLESELVCQLVHAWAKIKTVEGAEMVDKLLERLEKEVQIMGNKNTCTVLSKELYNMALDSWANSGDTVRATSKVENILSRMEEMYKMGMHNLQPDIYTYNTVIYVWAKSGEKGSALRAEQILAEMQRRCEEEGESHLKPDTITYTTVIHALSKSSDPGAAKKAEALLRNMVNRYICGERHVKPNPISFNAVADVLANSGDARRAEQVLTLLEELYYNLGNKDMQPHVNIYNTVINAWAKSGEKGSALRAEQILLEMIRRSDQGGEPNLRPNTITYNTVINALAKRGKPGLAERAEALLRNMIQSYFNGEEGIKPDTISFNAAIDAWACSGDSRAPFRAEQILMLMEEMHELSNKDNAMQPNVNIYNTVLNAWAKSREQGSASRVEQILSDMLRRCEEGEQHMKPNTVTYNTAIHALANSGYAVEKVEGILLNMLDRYNNIGDCKPDKISFNAVINAWARSGDNRAPSRAEHILMSMEKCDVQPDLYSYNAVINAWVKSGQKGSASRAEQILAEMERQSREDGSNRFSVKPDTVTYNTVIHALAKSGEPGAATKVEAILSTMVERYRNGDVSVKPDTITFNAVIDAWAKSGERGAAARAANILGFMRKQFRDGNLVDNIKPDARTYTTVLKACAFTRYDDERDEARAIAFRVFKELTTQKGMHPNGYTYTMLLSVCDNLLPKDDEERRFSLARIVFERCREAGFVNDYILTKLRTTITESRYIELLGSTEQIASRFPVQWTRNVPEQGKALTPKAGNSFNASKKRHDHRNAKQLLKVKDMKRKSA